ncbi:MAG: uracil-DNA glycosylase [Lachnospiraceae bacterium]|nr:uracil-DNA glycosylase [Lachnospiraceae bacterium]
MKFPENNWYEVLKDEFSQPYFKELEEKVRKEREAYTVYPSDKDVFSAFSYTDYQDVKVVILGQDPYHEPGQAHGLAFSVKPGVDAPPSLLNMYKELNREYGCFIPDNGYLKEWADQGVFLLNTVLTVREHAANSHASFGWKQFTDAVIKKLGEREEPIVFLLWGKQAAEKKKLISNPKHMILETTHPSPLSAYRGFLGCNHFAIANEFLKANLKPEIQWQISNLQERIHF